MGKVWGWGDGRRHKEGLGVVKRAERWGAGDWWKRGQGAQGQRPGFGLPLRSSGAVI